MFYDSHLALVKWGFLTYADLKTISFPEFFEVWERVRANNFFDK